MSAGRGVIIWGYLVETLLAGLVCLLGWLVAGVGGVTEFLTRRQTYG